MEIDRRTELARDLEALTDRGFVDRALGHFEIDGRRVLSARAYTDLFARINHPATVAKSVDGILRDL